MSRWTHLPTHLRTLAATSSNAVLLETSRFDELNRHSYLFLNPTKISSAHDGEELEELLKWMEDTRGRGFYLAGYFSYECGYHLEGKLQSASFSATNTSGALPLAWFGAYQSPYVFDHGTGSFIGSEPPDALPLLAPNVFAAEARLEISEVDYTQKILAIKRYIHDGDTYQVNFTDTVKVAAPHSAAASFSALSATQPVAYSALVHVADHHLLSLSPELFFRIRGNRITTRPMKGTLPRGLDLMEDEDQAARLRVDEKNCAEHVMIVDLLRNDLGRVCRMGSVQTDELFTVERYRTLFQMTSTISGELRPGTSFGEVFRALFPSGSITGAPKIRTMQIIHELEHQPRGVYTGAIGYIAPSGDAEFNVAIRTVVLHNGIAHMGVGGGIVADSDPASEYRECQLKCSFLTRSVPSFQLIETMLFDGTNISRLQLHLDRLESSACYFDFSCDRNLVEALINRLTANLHARSRVRLLLNADGEVTLTHIPLAVESSPLTVRVSPHRISSADVAHRHKTTNRSLYDHEYTNAREEGFDEALFFNERAELVEGAISNLFLQVEGRLITPPLSSGALPGVLRRYILATEHHAEERTLTLDDLCSAEAIFLGNSVRGLRKVERIESDSGITIYRAAPPLG